MCPIERICLTHADIDGEWIALIAHFRIKWFAVRSHEIGEKRVRTGSVPRRIGHADNVVIRALWKSRRLSEFRVCEFLAKPLGEVSPAFILAVERHAKAFNLPLLK